MITLLLIFALVYVGLAVLIAIGSTWVQGYFYEQPADHMAYRSAIAAAAMTAFLGVWAFIEHRAPRKFDTLLAFSAQEVQEFDQFRSEKKTGAGAPETTTFRRRPAQRGTEYVDDLGRTWKRSDSGVVTAIIVEEGTSDPKTTTRFAAKLSPKGEFLRDPTDPNRVAEVEYHEEGGKGRVMRENSIGTLRTYRTGAVIANLLFNLAHYLIWFVVLWFVMEFQPGHAVLVAFIGWLGACAFLWPLVQQQLAPPAATVIVLFIDLPEAPAGQLV
jgi:hypothetical protein